MAMTIPALGPLPPSPPVVSFASKDPPTNDPLTKIADDVVFALEVVAELVTGVLEV